MNFFFASQTTFFPFLSYANALRVDRYSFVRRRVCKIEQLGRFAVPHNKIEGKGHHVRNILRTGTKVAKRQNLELG